MTTQPIIASINVNESSPKTIRKRNAPVENINLIANLNPKYRTISRRVLLQSCKIKHKCFTQSWVYAGIPNNTLISVQTEKSKRRHSFRLFLYSPRMVSIPLIVVEAVRKLR